MTTASVMRDIFDERQRQDVKWGEQNHPPEVWMAILMEEVGELATESLHDKFGVKEDGMNTSQCEVLMREEAVQVAAVAAAFIECLDRNRGTQSPRKG